MTRKTGHFAGATAGAAVQAGGFRNSWQPAAPMPWLQRPITLYRQWLGVVVLRRVALHSGRAQILPRPEGGSAGCSGPGTDWPEQWRGGLERSRIFLRCSGSSIRKWPLDPELSKQGEAVPVRGRCQCQQGALPALLTWELWGLAPQMAPTGPLGARVWSACQQMLRVVADPQIPHLAPEAAAVAGLFW